MLYSALRKRGRPRLRRLDDLEMEMRNLGIRAWRRMARNREEWSRMVGEAEVLQGLQALVVSLLVAPRNS